MNKQNQRKAMPTKPKQSGNVKAVNQSHRLYANDRTTDRTQRDLARTANRTGMQLSDYVHCRVDPFSASGRSGIPDGANAGFTLQDIRCYDTISFPSFDTPTVVDFQIQTMPTLPCSALFTASTVNAAGTSINGTPIPGISSDFVPGGKAYPLSVLPPYQGAGAALASARYLPGSTAQAQAGISFANSVDPFGSVSSRLVSCGYRLTYTGPANSCSGVITVTPSDVAVTESVTAGTVTSQGGVSITATEPGLSPVTAVVPGGTPMYNIRLNSTGTTYLTRDSITLRPEQGLYIIPKHKSRDFKIKPLSTTVAAAVFNVDSGNAVTLALANGITSAGPTTLNSYGGGLVWYDNDWTGLRVDVRGANTDGAYRWETVWCMESNPVTTSPFANSTIKASANTPAQINRAENMTMNMPIARSANGSWARN